MKFIKSKLLQKAKGRKKGKYLITLEVTDYDLEMIEDLHHTYAPFEIIEVASEENDWNGKYSPNFTKKYLIWLDKVWHCFWKLWKYYDE